MYQAHNFNYPVNIILLRKWLGTINTFFYIIKIMFRYDASTNEDPARMSIVVVRAVSQMRKVIIQSQLQPEPQKHKYCSNGQKPEPYRSEARTSQIESYLSINPSQKRWREEKKSKSFLFSPDYLQFEDKGIFYQFSQKYMYPSFCCFFRLPPMSQRKFSSVFLRIFKANIILGV